MSLSEERDATCQMLLYSQHQAAVHMVSDIFHRWQDLQTLGDPGQMLSSLPQQQVEAMLERPCSPEIPCLTHRHLCRVSDGDIDVDITGSPCQDHSPCGNRLGCQGPRSSVFKAYCKTMRHLQPRIIIHENVCQFPASFLSDELSDIYALFPIYVDASHVGMSAISRQRSYVIGFHRKKTCMTTSPAAMYDLFITQINNWNTVDSPDEFFIATDEEVEEHVRLQAFCRGDPIWQWSGNDPETRRADVRRTVLGFGEQERLTRYEENLPHDSVEPFSSIFFQDH